ncbi:MAG: hypothetical protein M1833_004728 [Piccolia ochrophora]|nr:MAG: hypothetical protein M1833_004728 [Piccolia ochrophora]
MSEYPIPCKCGMHDIPEPPYGCDDRSCPDCAGAIVRWKVCYVEYQRNKTKAMIMANAAQYGPELTQQQLAGVDHRATLRQAAEIQWLQQQWPGRTHFGH